MSSFAVCGSSLFSGDIKDKTTRIAESFNSYLGMPQFFCLFRNLSDYELESQLVENKYLTDCFPSIILWIPSTINGEQHITSFESVLEFKKQYAATILIVSFDNSDNTQSFHDMLYKALSYHASLFIVFTKKDNKEYAALYDTLGNCWQKETDDFELFGLITAIRANYLKGILRIGSYNQNRDKPIIADVPKDFLEVVQKTANEFNSLIPIVEGGRIFGNASFRCSFGFSSFRDKENNKIFVSKRNVDKAYITNEGFVAVEPEIRSGCYYYGKEKPSVDTPIHLLIYKYFPKINFIIHGHVYTNGCVYTEQMVPCGGLNEFNEILKVCPSKNEDIYQINLIGHGCIVMASAPRFFNFASYHTRNMPEYLGDKK